MTQDPADRHQDDGDSSVSVSPDTRLSDPTDGHPPTEPADRDDATYAAGSADIDDEDADGADEADEDRAARERDGLSRTEHDPGPQGTDADSVSDGPDQESGFYG
ncbi:hypothetical protein [Nocardioides sp. TF02-7]|uniref:hypothetical protein n=1 Tax=Nocardioides sp. TF02-7 TaxID=2917724 RepID=UPI001F055D2C|nr:hypothetical protein [Nocardioides sp. TF02-7]UMG93722.1 hypothetical protein MF408_05975 [Nocardioides sp. TF02-7]